MRVTLLGTGTSTGIPVIGCTCRVCTSTDSRDRRLRCSAFVEVDGVNLVIDTGPDFRQQALANNIGRVDAVLFTHHHFDHVVGLDDLRPFCFDTNEPISCYARENTVAVLDRMFPYIFRDGSYPGVPNLELRTVSEPFFVHSRYDPEHVVEVVPIPVDHGDLPMFGYRIGNFAYLTDTNHVPDDSLNRLGGLDVLVLDALRDRPHPTHYTIDEAVEVAARIGAAETWLVHMTHSVLHEETDARLPEGVHLAYDSLVLDVAPSS
ncbi:MAG: MBL fold metallo-hydrolase [Rhodothermia bacterium]|nr:MBL fold metallo-hydrolase [Rhodothermia bacterium]